MGRKDAFNSPSPGHRTETTILGLAKNMKSFFRVLLARVHPEIADFGSGQGRSEFETAGVALLRRKSVEWLSHCFKYMRTPAWAKIYYFRMGTNLTKLSEYYFRLSSPKKATP